MTDTGLPELPEGYFWRVRYREVFESRPWGMGEIIADKTRLQIQLIHTFRTTETHTVKRRFRSDETVTTEDVREQAMFMENTLGTNPIAIRNAANRIMKLWAKAKERDALVGDYPPKTLEAS